jgi:hypothetical protein
VERYRTPLSLLLVGLAVVFVAYGLLSGFAPAVSDRQDPNDIAAKSELWITEQVARGGLQRTETGEIKKTYEGEQAPEACPT